MALKGKHAVAISTIRVRGKMDIEPGTVFEHESSQEANRLFSEDHLREATQDEIDLYEGRVKQGVIPRRTLSGEGDALMDGSFVAGGSVPRVTAAEAQAEADKKEAEKSAAKSGAKKSDDDKI